MLGYDYLCCSMPHCFLPTTLTAYYVATLIFLAPAISDCAALCESAALCLPCLGCVCHHQNIDSEPFIPRPELSLPTPMTTRSILQHTHAGLRLPVLLISTLLFAYIPYNLHHPPYRHFCICQLISSRPPIPMLLLSVSFLNCTTTTTQRSRFS